MSRIFTGRYWDFRHGASKSLVIVSISIGRPKFPFKPDIDEGGRFLAPWGLFDVEDEAEFERRYWHRLDGIGVDVVRRRLRTMHERHDGADLVLCCFEDLTKPGGWCHRRSFASWAQDRAGIIIPEWEELT